MVSGRLREPRWLSLSQSAVQGTAVSRGWILALAWKNVGEDWQGSVSQLSHHKMNDGERRKGPDPSAWRQDARATQSRVFQEKKLWALQGTGGQQRRLGCCQPLGPLFPQLRSQKTWRGLWGGVLETGTTGRLSSRGDYSSQGQILHPRSARRGLEHTAVTDA